MRVRDVMTRRVICAAPDMSLREVAQLLSDHGISGVPVVDGEGRCLGVVSEADILVKQVGKHHRRRTAVEWIFGDLHDPDEVRRRAATTAGEAMSEPPVTIGADRPIRDAAAIMVDGEVNRLPVVDEGRLVGIVTRADLVRAYLRLDEAIVGAVRTEVLRHTMWLDPGDFDIVSREGIVRIAGTVDRRSTAGIIERLIGVVDGVVEVQSDLDWEIDDSAFEPAGEEVGEPAAASTVAREHPMPLHR